MISAWWLLLLLLVVPAFFIGCAWERVFGDGWDRGFNEGLKYAYRNPEYKELFVNEKNV